MHAKTAEPIEMQFWGLSLMGPRNHDEDQGRTNPFATARGDEMMMLLFIRIFPTFVLKSYTK